MYCTETEKLLDILFVFRMWGLEMIFGIFQNASKQNITQIKSP
jgi:hypothetical protein